MIRLTNNEINILHVLVCLRSASAKQVSEFLVGPYSKPTYKLNSVYNTLKKLIEKKMITQCVTDRRVVNVTYFKLTEKGYELYKELNDVGYNYIGEGWFNASDMGDISYGTFTHNIRQLAHLDLVNSATVNLIRTKHVTQIRNNLYAAKGFSFKGKEYKLRPDLEFRINEEIYYVECDTGSESHEQLLQKFENYRLYYDSEVEKTFNILFVVPDKSNGNYDRRWTNILAAYLKVFYSKINMNVILTTPDNLFDTIEVESRRLSGNNAIVRAFINNFKDHKLFNVNFGTEEKRIGMLARNNKGEIIKGVMSLTGHSYSTLDFSHFNKFQYVFKYCNCSLENLCYYSNRSEVDFKFHKYNLNYFDLHPEYILHHKKFLKLIKQNLM